MLRIFKILCSQEAGNKMFITFPYPCMVEKVLFCGEILGMEILVYLLVLRSPDSEKHIFNGWSIYGCYQHNSKAN